MFIYQLIKSNYLSAADILILILALVVSAIFAIVLHEISHGYVALLNGDPTAKNNGRLTLNPKSHFSSMGLLMLLLVGFGWAKPVPINPDNFKNYKKGMVTVSLSGVVVNLILACINILLLFASLFVSFKYASDINSNSVGQVFSKLFIWTFEISIRINFMLALFNILPIYPLDGYNFVSTIFPNSTKYQSFMIRYGVYVLVGLVIFSNIMRLLNIWYLDIFGLFSSQIDRILNSVRVGAFKAVFKV